MGKFENRHFKFILSVSFMIILFLGFQNCAGPKGLELNSEEESFQLSLAKEDSELPQGPMAGDLFQCDLTTAVAIQKPGQALELRIVSKPGRLPEDAIIDWRESVNRAVNKIVLKKKDSSGTYELSYRRPGIRQIVATVSDRSGKQLCRSYSLLVRAESYQCELNPTRLIVARNESVKTQMIVSPAPQANDQFKVLTETYLLKKTAEGWQQVLNQRETVARALAADSDPAVLNSVDSLAGFYRRFGVVLNASGEEVCRVTAPTFRLLTQEESQASPRTAVSDPRGLDANVFSSVGTPGTYGSWLGSGSGGSGSGSGGNGDGWSSNSNDKCVEDSIKISCQVTVLGCTEDGRTVTSYQQDQVDFRLASAASTQVSQPQLSSGPYQILEFNQPHTCIGVDSLRQDNVFDNWPGVRSSGWFPSGTIFNRCALQLDYRPGKSACPNDNLGPG